MAWLLRQGEVLASVDLAGSFGAGARALAGRDSTDGAALLVTPARLVTTFGVAGALDVAFLDADAVVVGTARVGRNRATLPRREARSVLAARAGAFDRWSLRTGDRLEIKD